MPAATAATIRIFAVGLRPRPTLAPAMLVWVMVAVAESPLAEAVTRTDRVKKYLEANPKYRL